MENRKRGRYFLIGSMRRVSVVFLYSVIMAAAVYFFLAMQIRIFNAAGQPYCMLDCIHGLESVWNYGFFYFLLTVSMIVSGRKAYTYPAFVLQYENSEKIWKILFFDLLKKSVLYSIIYSSIVCLFSGMASFQVSNWHMKYSIFETANESLYTGKVIYVILAYFIFNIIKTFLGAGLLILFDSWFDGMIWGYFILLSVIVFELEDMGMNGTLFFHVFSISYQNFNSLGRAAGVMAAGILLMAAVYWCGRNIWKEKEFYGREGNAGK